MRSRIAVVVSAAAVFMTVVAAHAQTSPPGGGPGAAGDGAGAAGSIVLVLLGLLILVGGGVKFYDLRRRREAEAVHLQAQTSDALLREQALFGLAITPTVRVPTWKGSPAVIEVAGQVPTVELKEAALRIVRSEAARLRSDFEIEDRLAVVPTRERKAA